jgi:hypothetical protein
MDSTPPGPRNLEQLRARIEGGRYEVKADKVAEAMIRAGVIPARPREERRD